MGSKGLGALCSLAALEMNCLSLKHRSVAARRDVETGGSVAGIDADSGEISQTPCWCVLLRVKLMSEMRLRRDFHPSVLSTSQSHLGILLNKFPTFSRACE